MRTGLYWSIVAVFLDCSQRNEFVVRKNSSHLLLMSSRPCHPGKGIVPAVACPVTPSRAIFRLQIIGNVGKDRFERRRRQAAGLRIIGQSQCGFLVGNPETYHAAHAAMPRAFRRARVDTRIRSLSGLSPTNS